MIEDNGHTPAAPVATEVDQTSDISAVFERIQMEDRMKSLRHTVALLNQAISCAYCPTCGETICDRPWTINDEEHLVHEGCEK